MDYLSTGCPCACYSSPVLSPRNEPCQPKAFISLSDLPAYPLVGTWPIFETRVEMPPRHPGLDWVFVKVKETAPPYPTPPPVPEMKASAAWCSLSFGWVLHPSVPWCLRSSMAGAEKAWLESSEPGPRRSRSDPVRTPFTGILPRYLVGMVGVVLVMYARHS